MGQYIPVTLGNIAPLALTPFRPGRLALVCEGGGQRGIFTAGVLDELQIHQIPVLFGGGRRLFELLPSRIELEIVRVIDTPEATHIRYRVRR